MTNGRLGLALAGLVVLLAGCGLGDRTGFDVPVNADAIAAAGSASLPPDLYYPNTEAGDVVFSHGVHMIFASSCEQCHPEPWTWQLSPPGTMTMGPMYGTDSCGRCHDGQAAFDATACDRCHDTGAMAAPPELAEGSYPEDRSWPGTDEFGTVVFSHTRHAIAGEACDACHPFLFPERGIEAGQLKMAPMYAGQSCGRCHDGERTFAATDCGGCHEGAVPPVVAAAAAEAAAAAVAPPADES